MQEPADAHDTPERLLLAELAFGLEAAVQLVPSHFSIRVREKPDPSR